MKHARVRNVSNCVVNHPIHNTAAVIVGETPGTVPPQANWGKSPELWVSSNLGTIFCNRWAQKKFIGHCIACL